MTTETEGVWWAVQDTSWGNIESYQVRNDHDALIGSYWRRGDSHDWIASAPMMTVHLPNAFAAERWLLAVAAVCYSNGDLDEAIAALQRLRDADA